MFCQTFVWQFWRLPASLLQAFSDDTQLAQHKSNDLEKRLGYQSLVSPAGTYPFMEEIDSTIPSPTIFQSYLLDLLFVFSSMIKFLLSSKQINHYYLLFQFWFRYRIGNSISCFVCVLTIGYSEVSSETFRMSLLLKGPSTHISYRPENTWNMLTEVCSIAKQDCYVV